MEKRILGNKLEVSGMGLDCMGMSFAFPPFPGKRDMIKLIRNAVEKGVTFLIQLRLTVHILMKNY